MRQPSSLCERHRSPGELSSHAVWRYFRFLLSDRDADDLLAERGIAVGYETARRSAPHGGIVLDLLVQERRNQEAAVGCRKSARGE